MYAGNHESKLPPTLEQLIPDYLPNRAALVSPFGPDNVAVWYDYTQGLKDTDPPKTVLLRDHYSTTTGLRATVYLDGSGELK